MNETEVFRQNDVSRPDSETLIAVFAAAIAQYAGMDEKAFRVVSYRRGNNNVPVWNLRGRNDYLSGKL